MLIGSTVYAQPSAGPITITEWDGDNTIMAGANLTYEQGYTINIKGEYGNATDANWVRVTYDIYQDWAGDQPYNYEVFPYSDTSGVVDGTIDYDFTLPADAALGADYPTAVGKIIQVRVDYGSGEDTYWNVFVEITEGTSSLTQLDLEGLQVYPNPVTNGLVTINTANGLDKSVEIIDIAGKSILFQEMTSNTLDVSSLGSGMYYVKVIEDGKTGVEKLTIK